MTTQKHTPKLEAREVGNTGDWVLLRADMTKPGVYMRRVDQYQDGRMTRETAEQIARACNAHDDLVAALELARSTVQAVQDEVGGQEDNLARIDAALAAAKGGA